MSHSKRLMFYLLSQSQVVGFLLLSVACVTAPQVEPFNYQNVRSGQWQAKIEIENIQTGQTHTVHVNFKSIRAEKKIRADVKAVMGIHLASLVIHDSQYQALLIKKREYHSGTGRGQIIDKGVFGVEVDLRLLPAILYDESIEGDDWTCQRDDSNFLKGCVNLTTKNKFEIIERDGKKKKVLIRNADYLMTVLFENFLATDKFSEKTFSLVIPKGFKKI